MNNKNNNNLERKLPVYFEIHTQPLYYIYKSYEYDLIYPDSMDIKLIGDNVSIYEESKTFIINGKSYFSKGEIYIINQKNSDTIQTLEFEAIMPPITLMFCGTTGGKISANSFTEGSAIIATIINFGISINYDIVSYTMLLQTNDSIIEFPRTFPPDCIDWKIWEEPKKECSFFSQEQLDAIHDIKGTQIVIFKDIIIQIDTNCQKKLDPIFWLVEEGAKLD